MISINEYLFTVTDLNKPEILEDSEALKTFIVRLILLEPGTFLTQPEMGVGLVSNYRYSDLPSAIQQLQKDITNQISQYLPELGMGIQVTVNTDKDSENFIINISDDTDLGLDMSLAVNITTRKLIELM